MKTEEVRKAIKAIVPEGDLFEIRMIDGKWNSSGYFISAEAAITAMQETFITENANVYITLNHIKEGCGSRKQRNKFIESASPTTSDTDVDFLRYLMIDLDPDRVSGVSSSEAELSAAAEVSKAVLDFLWEQGWPDPLKAKSGNGYHLLYKLERLPVSKGKDDSNSILLQKVLQALNQKFGNDACHVDEVNYNPARICKLYGTMAQKGTNTNERPHRLSKLFHVPEVRGQVTKEQLEQIASMLESARQPDTDAEPAKQTGRFDLLQFLSKNGLAYTEDRNEQARIFKLEHCPFDKNHTNGDAKIFLYSNGAIAFKCHHNSCNRYRWQDVRLKYEPDAYSVDAVQPIPGKTVHTVPAEKKQEQQQLPVQANGIIVSGYDDIEIKPTDYLFFPWFPRGKLVAIQGDSGASKSSVMYAVGAFVSTGADLLGVPCEDSGNVLFLTIEDDAPDIKTAFIDSGGDISKLKRVTDKEAIAKMDLSEEGANLLDQIIKSENIKLLVLDPIQQYLKGDMNKANETRPQMGRLMNIAAENNICIAFISHTGKDTSKAALHRGIGSVDIGASTRSMLQVVTDPEDFNYKILFTVKNNTAAAQDTQKAIRYRLADHPGSYDSEQGKRQHFHGHAEFVEIIPEYNERIYTKQARKADESEMEQMILEFNYDKDPLVLTARELIRQNPNGVYIGNDDLIEKITQYAGSCPYNQSNDKVTGLNHRVESLRVKLAEDDGIQADINRTGKKFPSYNWNGEIFTPERKTGRGIQFTPVKGKKGDFQQQTKIC